MPFNRRFRDRTGQMASPSRRFGSFDELQDEETVVTLDDIVLDVVRVTSVQGWNAAENRADTGFQYDSYVSDEPVEATLEAWVTESTRRELESLANSSEPFPASIDHVVLSRAKLDSGGLEIDREGSIKSHYRATINISEIQEAEIDDEEIWLDTPAGEMGTSSSDTSRSIAYPQDDDTGTSDEASDESGIVQSLRSVREGLSGVLS